MYMYMCMTHSIPLMGCINMKNISKRANDSVRVCGNLTGPLGSRKDHDKASDSQQCCCDLRCEGGREGGMS